MEAFLSLLINLYLTTVVISVGIQVFKNYVSDKKIQKEGYKIINDNTLLENISDFICDYSYVFIPIRNIKKSFKLLLTSDRKYTKKRIEELSKENKLKKVEREEIIKEQVKELPKRKEIKTQEPIKELPPRKEIKKPEVIQIKEDKKMDLVKPFVEEINNSNDINFLEELKKEYRRRSTELRSRYQIILEKYKSNTNPESKKQLKSELNTIASNINIYDRIFVCARDRITELKKQQSKKQIK